MEQIITELENSNLLIERHKQQLENEGLYDEVEIDYIINERFLNSRVRDIDYLLDDLKVEIIYGTVIDKK